MGGKFNSIFTSLLKDKCHGDLYREAAAAREAREELGRDFVCDLARVRVLRSELARAVPTPRVSEAALRALADYARASLSKLPDTAEEHAAAWAALQEIVGEGAPHPLLLDEVEAWFDAKDWYAFCVPVALSWEEFQSLPSTGTSKNSSQPDHWPLDVTMTGQLQDDRGHRFTLEGSSLKAGDFAEDALKPSELLERLIVGVSSK